MSEWNTSKKATESQAAKSNLNDLFLLIGLYYIDLERKESFISQADCGFAFSKRSVGAAGPAEVTVAVEAFSQTRLQDLHQMYERRHFLFRTLCFRRETIFIQANTRSHPWIWTPVSPWWGSTAAAAARPPLCVDTRWSLCSHSSGDNRWCVSAPVMASHWWHFKSFTMWFRM